jgi:hypothetical protein
MNKEALIQAALEWAAQGVPVFPCRPDKAPMTERGHKDATTDPEQVKFLFSDVPEDTMIGAAMGVKSGLFACDFDLYKPGAEDYMRSLIDRGLLHDTQVHITRSGGLHFIYRGAVQPNCKPAFGVEVKGEGGYIIVPPSEGYQVERHGISNASKGLIEELVLAKKTASSASIDKLKRDVLSGKAFHDPLAQIAARRSASGWSVERVQRELLDVLGASAASNPSHPRHERWKALIEDRGEELSRIVGTGNDKYNASAKTEKVKDNLDDDVFANLNAASGTLFTKSGEEEDSTSDDSEEDADPLSAWPFAGAGYFSAEERDIRSQKYIAYPLLAERETILLAAEPKAGKTAIALKLAMAVAAGESLGDEIQIAEPRPVLYFTLEGARAVELRVAAERAYRRDNDLPVPERDLLFIVDRPHAFLRHEDQERNCARIALHSAKCQQDFGSPLGLIVIDTLTKAMPGGDQNSVEDTSQLFEMIGLLRSMGVAAPIAFLHHLSKQGDVRGSTNIEAEVDVVLGLQQAKNSTDVVLNIRRARSMDEDHYYRFSFTSYHLGETVQGFQLHAPVINLVGRTSPAPTDTIKEDWAWKQLNETLINNLGKGHHAVAELVIALEDYVSPPKGRRPDYLIPSVQKPLRKLFDGRHTWAFGQWHMTLERQGDNVIGIKIMFTS